MQKTLPLLLDSWFCFGAFVGYRRRRSRLQRELCLVVMTSNKHSPNKSSQVVPIPDCVSWRDGRNEFSLPTDVIDTPPEYEHQVGTVFGPGDVTSANGEVASIGAVVKHRTLGLCLTTAGHLFRTGSSSSAQVQSGSSRINCKVIEVKQRGSVDYALLCPTGSGRLDNLFRDDVRIGPVYTPGPQDLRRTVYLLHGDGGIRKTQCTGINGHFNSMMGTYSNLIMTDSISDDGNSGGALVDSNNGLWGFLLGRLGNRFSFYVPAQIILDVADVALHPG
jgi:hypothetical protein